MRVMIMTDETRMETGQEVAARFWSAVTPQLERRCERVLIVGLWRDGSFGYRLASEGLETASLDCRSYLGLLAGALRLRRRKAGARLIGRCWT